MILRVALASFTALWALSAQAQPITNPPIAVPIACAYNSTPVTLTDGQAGWIQCDSSGKLSISVSFAANSSVNVAQINGVTPLMGNGVTGPGSQRVTVASDNTPFPIKIDQTTPGTTNGVQINAALPAGSNVIGKSSIDQTTSAVTNGVMNAAGHYETVAASQTGQALGATGATGDYLSHCVVYPSSTSPGVVTVFDSTSSAGNNVIAFVGGASSLSNLAPFAIPVGAISISGAWKVTTGASVTVTCYGKFT